ncbi:pyridoxamine 5'-phosphate oxidase family protein [Nocardiopsis sp. CNT-189]|uniref:pyridoxamine 5'-phosphate oxidase family protein n=1 Tax=Nocardiopsis oceanisediminis TaxID=2816862 RepID=UPI003B341283
MAADPQPLPAPRPGARRRRDTEHRLGGDTDAWVATASPEGVPHLVPLSFDWDGEALLVSTPADSPTGRNMAATRAARVGLGHTRDVTMVEGGVEVIGMGELPKDRADRFAERAGFDPRAGEGAYLWFRITPRRIQAWREVNEMAGRELMRGGRWSV